MRGIKVSAQRENRKRELAQGSGFHFTYSSIGTKHRPVRQRNMASETGASQAGERVVRGSSSHVRGHAGNGWGCGGGCGRGSGIAGGAFDEVDGVVRLDLVGAQRIVVLQDATGVDEALALGRDVLVLFSGELRLELEDGGCLRHGDGVNLVVGGLHLEGDFLGAVASFCVVCHCLFSF